MDIMDGSARESALKAGSKGVKVGSEGAPAFSPSSLLG